MVRDKLLIDIRIPFCLGHCSFCTQTVFGQDKALLRQYIKALQAEIAEAAEELAEYEIQSVHIGGGTPAVIGSGELEDFLWFLRKNIPMSEKAQWVIDVLPSELSAAMFTVLRNARIDVIHVGVMTCQMKEFSVLKRPYYFAAFDGALSMITMYRQKGISLGLLVGIPGQTAESLENSIRYSMKAQPDQISLRPFAVTGEENQAELLQAAQACLRQFGMVRYGQNLDYAVPGKERREYLPEALGWSRMGFGVGAVTELEGHSYRNTEDMILYLAHSAQPQFIACEIKE